MSEIVCEKCGKKFASKSGHFYKHSKTCTGPEAATESETDPLASLGAAGGPEPENPSNDPSQDVIGQPEPPEKAREGIAPKFSAHPGCHACNVEEGATIATNDQGQCLNCGRNVCDPEPEPKTLAEVAAAQPNFKVINLSQNLKCELTPTELLNRARKMSQANSEIIRLEAELKSVKSQYNSQIDTQTATRDDMSRRVAEGCEWREVECKEYWDYDRHEVYVVRQDTFETVSSRTMTTAELQRGLDFPAED